MLSGRGRPEERRGACTLVVGAGSTAVGQAAMGRRAHCRQAAVPVQDGTVGPGRRHGHDTWANTAADSAPGCWDCMRSLASMVLAGTVPGSRAAAPAGWCEPQGDAAAASPDRVAASA